MTVTTIRQAHKDLTRERILDAAIELMTETMDPNVPTADIAARAGVTKRTLYRHFLSHEALAQAVWPRVVARLQARDLPHNADELIEMPLAVFPDLERREALVRATIYTDVARQASLQTNPARQAAMLACVEESLPELPADARRRRAAIALTICSAHGWVSLKDLGDLKGDDVGRAASEALAVLLGMQPADAAVSPSVRKKRTKRRKR